VKRTDNKKIRELIRKKYNNHCAYCGCILTDNNYTIDHISPRRRDRLAALRGSDDVVNFNPCCKSCNSSKSVYSIEKWREEIELKYSRLIRDSSQFRLLVRFGLVKKHNEVIFYFEKHKPNQNL